MYRSFLFDCKYIYMNKPTDKWFKNATKDYVEEMILFAKNEIKEWTAFLKEVEDDKRIKKMFKK